jgi:hypothetical protein
VGRPISLAGSVQLLSEDLLGFCTRQTLDRLTSIADQFPSLAAGFEVRISEPVDYVDLLLRATKCDGGFIALSGASSLNLMSPELCRLPGWQRIQEFAARLSGRDVDTYPTSLWCEVDHREGSFALEQPSFFLGINLAAWRRDRVLCLESVLADLSDMAVCPIPHEAFLAFRNCVKLLPDDVYPYQIGYMQSREVRVLRLCTDGWTGASFARFLAGVHYPGNARQLECEWSRCKQTCESVGVVLEIDQAITANVGLECYPGDCAHPKNTWMAFLNDLQRSELCLPDAANLLMRWPGVIIHDRTSSLQAWPAHYSRLESFLGHTTSSFVKILSHVKLVFDGQRSSSAKAYLGSHHAWL